MNEKYNYDKASDSLYIWLKEGEEEGIRIGVSRTSPVSDSKHVFVEANVYTTNG